MIQHVVSNKTFLSDYQIKLMSLSPLWTSLQITACDWWLVYIFKILKQFNSKFLKKSTTD